MNLTLLSSLLLCWCLGAIMGGLIVMVVMMQLEEDEAVEQDPDMPTDETQYDRMCQMCIYYPPTSEDEKPCTGCGIRKQG